jgi:hypothetical protein
MQMMYAWSGRLEVFGVEGNSWKIELKGTFGAANIYIYWIPLGHVQSRRLVQKVE